LLNAAGGITKAAATAVGLANTISALVLLNAPAGATLGAPASGYPSWIYSATTATSALSLSAGNAGIVTSGVTAVNKLVLLVLTGFYNFYAAVDGTVDAFYYI